MTRISKYLALDVETGGLDDRVHSLLEIGVVEVLDGFRPGRHATISVLERPCCVEPEVLRVNRIDLREWRGRTPAQALDDLVSALASFYGVPTIPIQAIGVAVEPVGVDVHLVGWNVDFDRRFLGRLGPGLRALPWRIHHRMIDVQAVVNAPRALRGEEPLSLERAVAHYGVDLDAACREIGYSGLRPGSIAAGASDAAGAYLMHEPVPDAVAALCVLRAHFASFGIV